MKSLQLIVCLGLWLVGSSLAAQETLPTEAETNQIQESLPLHVQPHEHDQFCFDPVAVSSFPEAIAGVVPKCYRGGYLHLDQRFGNGPGFDHSFATLGYFQPFWFEQGVFFADFQGSLDYDSQSRGSGGGNVGMGYRHYGLQRNRINGASVWYDLDNSYNTTQQQIGVSLESIGDRWNFFLNGYLPVDKRVRGPGERAATGVDFEAGRRLFEWNLWVYSGLYYYGTDGGGDTTGASLRFNSRLTQCVLLDLQVTDDSQFKTNVIFSLSFLLGKKGAPKSPGQQHAYNSLLQPVHRNHNVTVFK